MKLFHVKRTQVERFTVSLIVLIILFSWRQSSAQASAEWQDPQPPPDPETQFTVPSTSELILEINTLRSAYGASPLSIHPVLMNIAQQEANGIAAGMPGHWRPYGLTLGQWLIYEGYPLSGDLSLDGYRSENWSFASSAQGAIEQIHSWVSSGDALHTNTMLSTERSDIGVGVATYKDDWGMDQLVFVIETALQTGSGLQQSAARDFLTRVPDLINGVNTINGTPLALSAGQYIIPVILSTARLDGDVIHQVGYGQTLWSIAVYYGTTIEQIRKLNNLSADNTIYEGQKLLVKRGATQSVPTPTGRPTIANSPTRLPVVKITNTPSPEVEVVKNPESGELTVALGAIFLAFIVLAGVMISSLKMKS